MEYKILESWDREDLEENVNQALGEGWKLQGGIGIATDLEGYNLYCQAMVKKTGKTGEMKNGK